MDRSLQIRALVILAILALAGMSAYPPEEKINLGLDLRGGMHLVLQVKNQCLFRETELKLTPAAFDEAANLYFTLL